ncbi:MAG TPA: response regulator transcription factor [Nocardioidaceae bacterium]|nr:response regulator transcription factor [Nocardioidaceae bacterium]
MTGNKQRVVIVDDHKVFAELLALALGAESDLECVGHAQTVSDGAALVNTLRPDIVVMDVQLGDGDGIAATAELTAAHPELRVVVLTAFVERGLLQRAAAANACALLPKDGELVGMLQALRTAKRGGFAVHPELLRRLVARNDSQQPRPPSLTRREQEVLQMLAAGLDARLISREMGISVNTCRGYVKTLLAKLGAHSQLEAVAIAMRHGLIHVHSSI